MIWWLAACGPPVPADDTGIAPGDGQVAAVVTTTDFTVGAMAAIGLDDHVVHDDLFTTSSDPVVVVDGGRLFQLNRLGTDTISVYVPGEWAAPEAQFSVGAGTNPHDVALVGDALFVTLYERPYVAILDPLTGESKGEIDLSAHSDGDGSPEASSIVTRDGRLYVGLQRFDRPGGWVSTEGRVVEIDPDTREITDWWPVGPSPTLAPSADGILVRTGTYAALDGAVTLLDPAEGLGPPLLEEASLGYAIADVAHAAGGLVLIAEHTDGITYRVVCWDGETITEGPQGYGWLPDLAVNDRGEAWVAARAVDGGGLLVVDAETCGLEAGPLETSLDPLTIDFY